MTLENAFGRRSSVEHIEASEQGTEPRPGSHT